MEVTRLRSWGPTDDGRVKPDVVANGWQLLSTTASADDAYEQLSRTARATPAAARVCALLAELFQRERGRPPFADELKAALIHTAMSPHEGPDYRIGWGSIRADRAAELIAGERGILLRESVGPAGFAWEGVAQAGEPIRVTLVWIDPPGQPNAFSLDDPTPALVNDLDLVVTGLDGTVYPPWVLNSVEPTAPAVRGANRVDNVERVDVPGGEVSEGEWRLTVTGPGVKQALALAVSGLVPAGEGEGR